MKNILKVIALFTVVLLMVTTTVMAEPGDVEISFCVGDETLTINGTPVTVEKPYVVGEGVTLVPLRVITEAFGATVDWDGSTKTVTLTYPDVKVILQIDNPIAEVNGKAEKLLSAPELTDTGFTFVPLRFLSETFGAEVSYDNDTKKITVTKGASSTASTVEGAVSNKNIGDSYYGWSMENPKDMVMAYRSFDGRAIIFKADEDNSFAITINHIDDEYNFDQQFNNSKTSITGNGYTLVKAEKNYNNPKAKVMNIQAKNKTEVVSKVEIQTDKYVYSVYGRFDAENENKDDYLRIISTFNCTFNVEDVHDLSEVKNGFRRYENEKLKLSFDVPEDYYLASSEDSENEFCFRKSAKGDYFSEINLAVYSKDGSNGAEYMANKDFEHNSNTYNEEVITYGEGVVTKEYDSFTAYEYDIHRKYENMGKSYGRDVFFEYGDYVYNVSVFLKLPMDDYEEYVTKIINSFKVDEIDFNEVGTLIKDYNDATGTIKSKIGKVYITIPDNFVEKSEGDVKGYESPYSGYVIMAQELSSPDTLANLRVQIKELEKSYKDSGKVTFIKNTGEKKTANNTFIYFATKETDGEDFVVYTEVYATVKNKRTYLFIVEYSELGYSSSNRQRVLNILGTLDTK